MQGKGRPHRLLVPVAVLLALLPAAVARAAPGDLDPTFGGDGRVALPAASGYVARAVAIDSSDRIVVGGYVCQPEPPQNDGTCLSSGDTSFRIARLTPDGGLDAEFGQSGFITTPIDGARAEAFDMLLTDDGRILAGGVASAGGREVFAIACYLPDGSLDPAWGTGGIALAPIGSGFSLLTDIALGPDGTVLAAGQALDGQGVPRIAIARFSSSGAIDQGFGQAGATLAGSGGFAFGQSLVAQPDGSALVAGLVGDTSDYRTYRFAALRVSASGAPDTTFSGDGLAEHRIGTSSSYANAAAAVPGGWLAAGAASGEDGRAGMSVLRGRPSGRLDRRFGRDGSVTVGIGTRASATDVLVDGDHILLVGQVRRADGGYDFGVARLTQDGALDRGFGTRGAATVSWPDYPIARATAGVLQSSGRLVTVGIGCAGGTDEACTGGSARLLVARQFAGADRTPPAIDVAGRPQRSGARRLRVRIALSEPGRLRARLDRRGRTLARAADAGARRSRTIFLRTPARLRPGRYRLTVRATDAAGNTAARSFTLRLRAQPA